MSVVVPDGFVTGQEAEWVGSLDLNRWTRSLPTAAYHVSAACWGLRLPGSVSGASTPLLYCLPALTSYTLEPSYLGCVGYLRKGKKPDYRRHDSP